MVSTRVKYISNTLGAGGIIALITWFALNINFAVQLDGDVICRGDFSEPCEAHFNITSTVFTYYLYNKVGVDLNFIPNVKDSYICKRDGRFKASKRANREEYPCGIGWREFDFKTPLTSRYQYVEKFTRGKKKEYKLVVFKFNPTDEIKWGGKITGEEIDPKFLPSINVTPIKQCHFENYETTEKVLVDVSKTRRVIYESIYIVNGTVCDDEPFNTSCTFINIRNITQKQAYKENYIGQEEIEQKVNKTKQVCVTTAFRIGDKLLEFKDWECKRQGFFISCDETHQGNLDGICQSGECCATFDIRDNSRKDSGCSKTKTIEELKIE